MLLFVLIIRACLRRFRKVGNFILRLYGFNYLGTGLLFLLIVHDVHGQKLWDGGGGDQQWDNGLNWAGDILPQPTDNVILDNSLIHGSYIVHLPPGMTTVTVRTLVIAASSGNSIELLLPVSNAMIPGFVATGPGYGLLIRDGGIFRNASGAESGNPVSIADSMRINNGGRYVHNTAGGHAANVNVLSAAPGTETGIMEFDIPDPSSTLSLSGRVYGKLVLHATAAGGSLNYTAAGTNKLLINSDLELGEGVTFGLNFSDTIFINRDLLQHGGVFNLGNTARTVVLAVKRHISQSEGAHITETGTGKPVIMLCGNEEQQVAMDGNISNDVGWKMNGAGGAMLRSSLSLPYRLDLVKGKLSVAPGALLTLLSGCSVSADTVSRISFVNGPLKKQGLNGQDFLFPVGEGNDMRWVALRNATGDFMVRYYRNDPNALSGNMGMGLHHISALEYWSIESDNGSSARAVTDLSFNEGSSGGVTNLSYLKVARLVNGLWEDSGNASTSGTAGADGSVSSQPLSNFSSSMKYFTLGSSRPLENPLPLEAVSFRARSMQDHVLLEWETADDKEYKSFELEVSYDGRQYRSLCIINAVTGKRVYQYVHRTAYNGVSYFRIRTIRSNGTSFSGRVVFGIPNSGNCRIAISSTIAGNSIRLFTLGTQAVSMSLFICDIRGSIVRVVHANIVKDDPEISLNVNGLPAGVYHVFGISSVSRTNTIRFFKR